MDCYRDDGGHQGDLRLRPKDAMPYGMLGRFEKGAAGLDGLFGGTMATLGPPSSRTPTAFYSRYQSQLCAGRTL
jgi:hypothetical protein